MDKPVYALSIKQPWAFLICKGFKDVENRDWKAPVKYWGERIYIHASKKEDTNAFTFLSSECRWGIRVSDKFVYKLPQHFDPDCLKLGLIIGEATLKYCVDCSASPWFVGKYGFVLANQVLYDKPIPCRGMLGFFKPEITEVNHV